MPAKKVYEAEGFTTSPVRSRRKFGLTLTDALNRKGNPEELANLIIEGARNGDSVAIRLWAQYIQSPETVTRIMDDAQEAVGYELVEDEVLDAAITQLEQELLGPGKTGERDSAETPEASAGAQTL